MRKARESTFEVGPVRLTVRRPTDLDALGMRYTSTKDALLGVSEFIVGWSGMTELDLFPGGTGKEVPFDREIFVEWIKDNPDHWSTVIDKVRSAYTIHSEKTKEITKNSEPG